MCDWLTSRYGDSRRKTQVSLEKFPVVDEHEQMEDISNLSGKLLIALPGMGDPRFEKSVIYICSHNSDGAMGIIINKAKGEIVISDLLDQVGINGQVRVADTAVLDGGPVDIDRGFVLHTADYYHAGTSLRISETLALTSTKDVLEALTTEDAPNLAILAVGYSGWGGGQLEREIQQNAWMIVDGKESLIFEQSLKGKWAKALSFIGVTPDMLSHFGGSA